MTYNEFIEWEIAARKEKEAEEAMREARGNDGVSPLYLAQMPDFVGAGYKMTDRELELYARINE